MTPDNVMSTLVRYLEGHDDTPLSVALGHAGEGGCDGHSTGGITSHIAFQCSVGSAIKALTRAEWNHVSEYLVVWDETRLAEKEAQQPGASAMPGAPWHKKAANRGRELDRMRHNDGIRSAIDKLGDELDRRLGH